MNARRHTAIYFKYVVWTEYTCTVHALRLLVAKISVLVNEDVSDDICVRTLYTPHVWNGGERAIDTSNVQIRIDALMTFKFLSECAEHIVGLFIALPTFCRCTFSLWCAETLCNWFCIFLSGRNRLDRSRLTIEIQTNLCVSHKDTTYTNRYEIGYLLVLYSS